METVPAPEAHTAKTETGLPAHPVLDLIRKRAAEKSRPLQRSDDAHVALGLLDTFDSVYGASVDEFADEEPE